MGVGMELDFEKYCRLGRRPKTTLPLPRFHPKSENQSKKEKLSSRHDILVLEEEEEECLTETKFRNYRSVSCKSLPTGKADVGSRDQVLRRGSVYQSSRDTTRLNRSEIGGGRRKKIEFSLDNWSPFSLNILDSICDSDEESVSLEQECSSITSPTSSSWFSSKTSRETSSQEECLSVSGRECSSAICAERDLMENLMFKSDQVIGPQNDANVLKERDNLALQKSLPSKLALPLSSTHADSGDRDSKGSRSPKSRFTPIRKMFDPRPKSKSHCNPLISSTVGRSDSRSAEPANVCRSKTFRKSLLQDFSSATQNLEGCQAVKWDHRHHQKQQAFSSPCSPAHLRGNLKLEHKHGVPYFEFSLTHTEDVFVAKTWKAEDTLNWVYTFHSVHGRKRSNANGWGAKYSNKDSPMVGQMQVSCYIYSDLRKGGSLRNSMMTEFVLYDIAHARQNVKPEEETGKTSDMSQVLNSGANESLVGEALEFDDLFYPIKSKSPVPRSLEHGNSDFSSPYPLASADLHPSLEIAAVVIQVPLEKRESLKYKRGDKIRNQVHTNLLDASLEVERPTKDGGANSNCRAEINVVTPMGNHGLPTVESRGPSPLLDRWKLGGGCDCGGWDMACPLLVFGSHGLQLEEDVTHLKKDQPLELHMQGTKDETPALCITNTGKGHYAVCFHAQLSTVQAFAICVAVLHASEASSPTTQQEINERLLQCSKVLLEDGVKRLIESVTEEERRRASVKATEEIQHSFVINPPFSPISRV